MFLFLIAIIVLILLYRYVFVFKPKNFPPGPPCLPIIGSIHHIPTENAHFKMSGEWMEKYGPIVGFMFGQHPTITVSGAEEVLEVLKREEFQGRPDTFNSRDRSFHKRLGFFFTDGPYWVDTRRFTLRHLRDLGFGKKSIEGLMLEEAEELIETIKGDDFMTTGSFGLSVINVLWAVMGGRRHAHNDVHFRALLDKIAVLFRRGNPSGDILDVLPALRFINSSIAGYKERKTGTINAQEFLRESIIEHKRTIDENEPRDFIDVYLKEMKNNETYTEDGLIMICLDLFLAGAESVSNTIDYMLLYMVLYPHIQKKIQQELDNVVGTRRPSLNDRANLPYLDATLTEVFRVNPIAPLAPLHRVMKDVKLNGYTIKKDTTVIVNLWGVLSDKSHWGDPEVFRPERFIDSNGKFVKDDWMINFGLGKRFCLGEALARNVLFLFIATFLQEFSFSIPDGDPKPSTVPQPGFTTAPQPFKMKIKQRT